MGTCIQWKKANCTVLKYFSAGERIYRNSKLPSRKIAGYTLCIHHV
jgi:hypothetical protein